MITRRVTTMVMALCLLGSGVFVSNLWAAHGGEGVGGLGFLRTLLELKLSDDQQGRLLAVLDRYEAAMKAQRLTLIAARKQLAGLIRQDTFDEAALRTASRNLSSAQEELAVLRARMFHDAMSVLTPDQQEKIKAKIAKRMQRLRNRVLDLDTSGEQS